VDPSFFTYGHVFEGKDHRPSGEPLKVTSNLQDHCV
jgi:hypothetical protein